MSNRFVLMLASGFVVFGIGALTRTYMNILISQSPLSHGSNTRSTELRYKRLIKERGANVWPTGCDRHMHTARNTNWVCGYHLEQPCDASVAIFRTSQAWTLPRLTPPPVRLPSGGAI
jgi:hypothetical protein